MKFNEAMAELMKGKKVTRKQWLGSVYFIYEDNKVKSFQPKIVPYIYEESIMISDGWKVEGKEEKYYFYDIIDYLKQGKKVKQESWSNNSFIYYDGSSKCLVYQSMSEFPYVPEFESFNAQDWITIP